MAVQLTKSLDIDRKKLEGAVYPPTLMEDILVKVSQYTRLCEELNASIKGEHSMTHFERREVIDQVEQLWEAIKDYNVYLRFAPPKFSNTLQED